MPTNKAIHLGYLVCLFIQLNLTELRTFPNPPAIVTNVSAAVLVLLSPQGRIPKDRSWKASKMVMSKVIFHPEDLYCLRLMACDHRATPASPVKYKPGRKANHHS